MDRREPIPLRRDGESYALEMEKVSKVFGKTQVLFDVDFRVRKRSVHALLGANGAGKSTLMKIAEGVVRPTSGKVAIGGKPMTFSVPGEGRAAGLGMVFQELSLIPSLSVMDNIFLNAERVRAGVVTDLRAQRRETIELFERLGVSISPDVEVGSLGVAEQQMVEIAKALRLARYALVLDEPTAALTDQEVSRLFRVMRQLAGQDVGVVFTTHRLAEVFEVCDEVTVLRDGRVTLSSPISETNLPTVVRSMIGTEASAMVEGRERSLSPTETPLLRVRNLGVKGKLAGVSFDVIPGEIVGIAGLTGSGRTELLKAIFGALARSSGTIEFRGRPSASRSPADAIDQGIFLIPESRRTQGLVLGHSIGDNVVMPLLRRLSRFFVYDVQAGRDVAERYTRDLQVKAEGIDQPVDFLSGGNQQKVVLAKALSTRSRLLLLDEPTFGIDIKTSREIQRLAREFADAGNCVIWVTSELEELIEVSDRILVLAEGRLKTVIENFPTAISEEELAHAIQPQQPNGTATEPAPARKGGAR